MFQITKFTLSDRIYPIERTYMRIEDLLRPSQILRAVKVRAIWLGKEPCFLVHTCNHVMTLAFAFICLIYPQILW